MSGQTGNHAESASPPSEVVEGVIVAADGQPIDDEEPNQYLKRRRGRPPDGWKDKYIEVFSETPIQGIAATEAGVSVATVRRHLAKDTEFAEAVNAVRGGGVDRAKYSAWQRAFEGITKVTRRYDKEGKVIVETTEVVFDSRLTELFLKFLDPEGFVDRLRLGPDDGGDRNVDAEIMAAAQRISARFHELEQQRALAAGAEADTDAEDPGEIVDAEVVEDENMNGQGSSD